MNLLMFGVLLFVALFCQPTLIYGLKGSHSVAMATNNGDHDLIQRQRSVKTFGGKVKRSHSNSLHASAAELASAKLVMALESGDVLMRRAARGINGEGVVEESATVIDAAATSVGGGNKRNKNSNNNKKLNKNSDSSNVGRKQEKKYSATIGSQTQQQQHQQQQQHHGHHGNSNGNGNGRGKQRQQHSGHGKRSGNGSNGNGAGGKMLTENAETLTAEKSQTSCRYSKSAWTDCDSKTNMRTRTLTLKKGEISCLPTRTMQKKCRKSCRYEKGAWSECINGQMTRQDKLKSTASIGTTESTADSSCEPIRNINKKCNPGGAKMANKVNKERKHKEKVQRRAQQQA